MVSKQLLVQPVAQLTTLRSFGNQFNSRGTVAGPCRGARLWECNRVLRMQDQATNSLPRAILKKHDLPNKAVTLYES